MKFRTGIILFSLSIFVIGCTGYENDAGTIYYKSWNEGTGSSKKELKWVSAKKFRVLIYEEYAKDDERVFYQGKKIEGADAKTFEAIGDFYARDKYRGYYGGDSIRSSSGTTFKIIDSYYSTDGKDIFYDTIPLKVASVKNFRFVFKSGDNDWERWTTDGKYYYFKSFKVPSNDYAHMVLYQQSGGISKDSKWAYFLSRKLNFDDSGKRMIDTIDIPSFKVTGYIDCRDKYGCINIFHGREKCKPAN